jgi:hypothetical protein
MRHKLGINKHIATFFLAIAALVFLGTSSKTVQAAPVYVCDGICFNYIPVYGAPPVVPGKLVSILDVQIGAASYDVAFVDGTFNSVFGTTPPALSFSTESQARAASLALSEVLVNNPSGDFDSVPSLTRGCSSNQVCAIDTPFETSSDGFGFQYVSFVNVSPLYPDLADAVMPALLGSLNGARTEDYGLIDSATFAVWRFHGVPFIDPATHAPSPINLYFDAPSTSVPEPTSLLLLALGLACIVGARKTRIAAQAGTGEVQLYGIPKCNYSARFSIPEVIQPKLG